jgi:DNA-binding IclR family transcriptional regulator
MAKILELLSDGGWHTLDEIRKRTELTKRNITRIIQFLEEYNFVVVDKEEGKIRLNENVRKFLAQTVKS